jgi:nuclear transport factor 2 (NTF2) superfamily protein
LIFTAEILNTIDAPYRLIRTLYAFTAIAMWLRFLYFFRIFKATNFYIRMIVEVVIDMG